MQILCPVCGVIAQAKDIQSDSQGLSWTCGACGRRVSESIDEADPDRHREPEGAAPDVSEDETDRCPKCGAPRTDRPDCPRCGLVFDRWDPASGLELIPGIEAAWEELLDSYEDEAAHARFLARASELGRLDLAAAYYRARSAEFRDDPMAAVQLKRIASMVQFEALVPRQRRQLVSPAFVWAMRIVLGIVVLVGLYYVFTFSPPPPNAVETVQPAHSKDRVTGGGAGAAGRGTAMGPAGTESRKASPGGTSSDSGAATPIFPSAR